MPAPARDLTPFFAPDGIAIVGAGERATPSGGAVMQMLRQAGYGGRVVPVNPRGGSIFGYESVTSIAAIEPAVDLAVIVIRRDAILEAVGKADWFATLERAGVAMFNDAEEMAEAAGLPARYPILCDAAKSERLPPVTFNDRKGA